MTYRIMATDNLDKEGVMLLSQHPEIEVDVIATMSEEELIKIIGKYHGLIIRSATKVTAKVIEAAKNMKLIARAGVGTDNIDKVAASSAGILVMNAPGGNTISTAEQTLALMLALIRKLPWAHFSTAAGKWERKKYSGNQLYGKNIGVIGLGRIGREVALRAKAFGMKVMGFDPPLSTEQFKALGIEKYELDHIFRNADIITVHTPLTDKTSNLITKKEIELMKPSVLLINSARGGIYNEQDIADALKENRIAGAAFDVYSTEPPENNPLLGAPNCITTCHLGASTAEAQVSVALEAAEVMIDYFKNGNIRNAVNFPNVPVEILNEAKGYIELARQMGKTAASFIHGSIKEINIGYKGETTSRASNIIARSAIHGVLEPILSEEATIISAMTLAKDRGIVVTEYEMTKPSDYPEEISLEVVTDVTTHSVEGVLQLNGEKHIIDINGYEVDINTEGMYLAVRNNDVPGIVGKIGTILGKYKINIANMYLARKSKGKDALSLIQVDSDVSKEVVEEFLKEKDILETKMIYF